MRGGAWRAADAGPTGPTRTAAWPEVGAGSTSRSTLDIKLQPAIRGALGADQGWRGGRSHLHRRAYGDVLRHGALMTMLAAKAAAIRSASVGCFV